MGFVSRDMRHLCRMYDSGRCNVGGGGSVMHRGIRFTGYASFVWDV